MVWQDITSGHNQIFFTMSHDQGITWSTTTNLSNDSGSATHSRIIVYGKNIFVSWTDTTSGHSQVLYIESHDGGKTFGIPINISQSTGIADDPTIINRDSNVYVVWEDNSLGTFQVMFRVSNDNGSTFNAPVNLSHGAGNASSPVMTAHGKGGDVNVVWEDNTGGNYQIIVGSSNDGGITWTTPFNISHDSGVATNPIVVARGNNTGKNVFVAWQDTTPGNSQIFTATSNNNGKTWNNPINVSNDSSSAINARIQNRQGSQAVYVVWTESTLEVIAESS